MAKFRLVLLNLAIWLTLLFNLERPDIFGGNIDLASYVYVIAAAIVMAILMFPDFAQLKTTWLFLITLGTYVVGKLIFGVSSDQVTFAYTTTVEVAALYITVLLAQMVSSTVSQFENVVDNTVLITDNSRVLPTNEGVEKINKEIFRARRFGNPMALLFVNIRAIRGVGTHLQRQLDLQVALRHRYIQGRIARTIEDVLYFEDIITLYHEDLVLCFPETGLQEAHELAKQINKLLMVTLDISLQIGVAVFPDDALIFEELVDLAATRLMVVDDDEIEQNDSDSELPAPYEPEPIAVRDSPFSASAPRSDSSDLPSFLDDDDVTEAQVSDNKTLQMTLDSEDDDALPFVPAGGDKFVSSEAAAMHKPFIAARIGETSVEEEDLEQPFFPANKKDDDDDDIGGLPPSGSADKGGGDDQTNEEPIQSLTAKYILKALFSAPKLLPDDSLQIASGRKGNAASDPDFWVNKMSYPSASSRLIYRKVKRLMDLVLVILSFPFIIPALLFITIAVYLDSGGPVFFAQSRTGKGGHRFKMYKFRTMVPNAEEKLKELAAQGLAKLDAEGKLAEPLKLKRDPRVTRVGYILRKTSLDELPQLINVFKGNMSLVGPRPTSWDVNSYTLLQTERLSVRPGITGLWQVCSRGNTDFDIWLKWDMKYIEKMSFLLDIKIVIQTFLKVMNRSGAH
jgi:lipopolysaccharide/colanic/teichoic acid biosynthesis glycosyltransferase